MVYNIQNLLIKTFIKIWDNRIFLYIKKTLKDIDKIQLILNIYFALMIREFLEHRPKANWNTDYRIKNLKIRLLLEK